MSLRYTVVGGGMLGLTTALRLSQCGHEVTLLEAAPELGGLAAAWQIGDLTWDKHYHVTLLSDQYTRGVLRDLGLEAEMSWVETRTGFYSNGRLVSMSNALEYLRLPGLTLVDKARLAFTILYGARVQDWRRLEQTPVEDWLTQLSGRGTFEKLWLPLLRAKLGESYRESSAAFIWATIQRLYAARRTGLKKEMFGYVPGGYARILETFERVLRERGVRVELGAPVRSIETKGSGDAPTFEVAYALGGSGADGSPRGIDGELGSVACDRVVVTLTPRRAAEICPGLADEERKQLGAIRYQGVLCASLVLSKPLADYYLTYLTDDDLPFTAVVEMSAFVDRSEFGGRSLVYLPKYTTPDDPLFTQSDDEIRERFAGTLERMYPHFDRGDIEAFGVSRVAEVFPVPVLGYSRRLPRPSTSVPGLHVVSSAHIVNGTLNVNDTVSLAERAATSLAESDGLEVVL